MGQNNLCCMLHNYLLISSAKIEEKRKREAEKRSIEEEQVCYVYFSLNKDYSLKVVASVYNITRGIYCSCFSLFISK